MRAILFDADAFICVRAMSLLRLLRSSPVLTTPMLMTEYVARHELRDVQTDVDSLVKEGRLNIHQVSRRKTDPSGQRYREYIAEGLDKGEAESLAWVMGLGSERPFFVSNDGEARAGFRRLSAPAGDVLDLIVDAVESGGVPLEAAREVASAAWDDRPNNQCRPRDYTDFDASYARRRSRHGP